MCNEFSIQVNVLDELSEPLSDHCDGRMNQNSLSQEKIIVFDVVRHDDWWICLAFELKNCLLSGLDGE